jgi:hypothetical protein
MTDQFKNTKKKIEPDSYWFLISMTWIKKWEKYVFMDEIENPEKEIDPEMLRKHPGPIDCSDIIEDDFYSLKDKTLSEKWMNT